MHPTCVKLFSVEKTEMYQWIDGWRDGSNFLSVCVQKFPTDKAYFIAKELLTTERTYLKDLQVITEVRRTFLT